MENVHVCPNCFKEGFQTRCDHCGYVGIGQGENHLLLPPGTQLNNRYTIGRVLGAGGFGITYLAKDNQTGGLCAVKEYLPATLAVRDSTTKLVYPSSQDNAEVFRHGLSQFEKESEILRKFYGNPAIVQVMDRFKQNGTAYFVMEFLDGVPLKALVHSMQGKLPFALALEVLIRTGETLAAVHAQGLLHRDVSPDNIFITKEGHIKLIDFGATRYFLGEQSRSLSVILKPGFAPPEQYSSKGNQGAWTDVYALCATFYFTVTGSRLPDAPDRLAGVEALPLAQAEPGIAPGLEAAMEKGLRLNYRERFPSVEALLQAVQASSKATETPTAGYKPDAQVLNGTPFIQLFLQGKPRDKWILPKNMPMVIGRASDKCNIVFDAANVSRMHCTIAYDDKNNCFYLTDVSSNGTLLLSGTRLTKDKAYTLKPEDGFCIIDRNTIFMTGVE